MRKAINQGKTTSTELQFVITKFNDSHDASAMCKAKYSDSKIYGRDKKL